MTTEPEEWTEEEVAQKLRDLINITTRDPSWVGQTLGCFRPLFVRAAELLEKHYTTQDSWDAHNEMMRREQIDGQGW